MRLTRAGFFVLLLLIVALSFIASPERDRLLSRPTYAAASFQLFLPAVFPKGPDPHAVLNELNRLRSWGKIPPVAENLAWNDGAVKHSRYMVMNQQLVHEEDPANRWYTVEGDAAGRKSDIIL